MTHARKTVRAAFATAVTNLSATGARVYQQKKYALAPDELPALRIYVDADEVEETSIHSGVIPMLRRVEITCEAVAKAASTVEDTIDTICEQVEGAINANPTLSSACVGVEYVGFDADVDVAGDQPVMVGRMRFNASINA